MEGTHPIPGLFGVGYAQVTRIALSGHAHTLTRCFSEYSSFERSAEFGITLGSGFGVSTRTMRVEILTVIEIKKVVVPS
jgi:hypothetical protein